MRRFDEHARKELVEFLNRMMDTHNLSNSQVTVRIQCVRNQYVTWLKNPTYWKIVPQKVWDKLYDWKEAEDKHESKKPIDMKEKEEPVKKSIIEIEKGIPLPESAPRGSQYPFEFMEVGDSFKVPIEEPGKGETKSIKRTSSQIGSAARHFRRKHPEYKFVVRMIKKEGIIRCWRMK